MKEKIQTLTKKSVELTSQFNCKVLLIIYSENSKHWVQYCNSEAEKLFFGYQMAKEHLETIEKYDNTNYYNLTPVDIPVEKNPSQKPSKKTKISEDLDAFSQPIKIAGKNEEPIKSSVSTISTEYSIQNAKANNGSIVKDPPDPVSVFFPCAVEKPAEVESSSDFDFETYFLNNNT